MTPQDHQTIRAAIREESVVVEQRITTAIASVSEGVASIREEVVAVEQRLTTSVASVSEGVASVREGVASIREEVVAVEQRLTTTIHQEVTAVEQRLMNAIADAENRSQEFSRNIETNLLTAFQSYSKGQTARFHTVETVGIDLATRITALEERVLNLETRRPPH